MALSPSPHDYARTYDVRGRIISVRGVQSDSGRLLDDTFWPDGTLDVRRRYGASSQEGEAEIEIVETVADAASIRARLDSLRQLRTPLSFEVTRDVERDRHVIDDETTVYDLAGGSSPAFVERRGRVRTIVRTADRSGARWLTRIIRDVATRIAAADGSLILHSSAFTTGDGRTFLVIGDSGAGKSTTSIALARLQSGWAWLGNDRMHVDRGRDSFNVTACPLPLAVNKGSLDAMGVVDFADWPLHNGHPGTESDWDKFMGEDKLKLSNREVELYLGARVIDHGTLAGLLFPRISLGERLELESADSHFTEAVLSRNCFSRDDNLYGPDWLGAGGSSPSRPLLLAEFLDGTAHYPRLRCTLGSGEDIRLLADAINDMR